LAMAALLVPEPGQQAAQGLGELKWGHGRQ
jgi:hypothetical protein